MVRSCKSTVIDNASSYLLGSSLLDVFLEDTALGLFDDITNGVEKKPRRVLLYGVHGVGKSTWAADSPNAIFLPTEDGISDIDCAKFPTLDKFASVMEALRSLYTETHDYNTLVIDSADWLERQIWEETCTEHGKGSIDAFGYGKGYSLALQFWQQVITALDELRRTKGLSVIIVAHSKIEKFESPESESYDRYSPKLHKVASAYLQEWVDEVLFASYRVHVTKESEKSQGRFRGIGSGERVLRTTERPSHVAKNRLGLPDELPLLWSAYYDFVKPASVAKTAKNAKNAKPLSA